MKTLTKIETDHGAAASELDDIALTSTTPAGDIPDLAGDAYNTLLDMIQLGRLRTETPLQERALAATLGISRTPLREAMSRLIGGGFAVRTPRGQLMIKEPTLRQYLEILQMRGLLESEAAAQAATRMDPKHAQYVIAQVEAHLLARNTTKDENHRIDNLLHDTVATASGNQMLAQTIHDLRIKARCFDQNGAPERFEPCAREHIAILQAIAERNADAARAAMSLHLANARAGLVARHTNL
ncbi:GntR family transcriptional regulator [Cupriavidus sp. 2MCAB6]|uniref:GntR family transcriptional regulator n=1 Tax=Cupriavidus sp. 2MCAB6 TaxID=3232981 RepID=UPI003F8DCD67